MYHRLLFNTQLAPLPVLGGNAGQVLKGSVGFELEKSGESWIKLAFFQDGADVLAGWVRRTGDDGNPRIEAATAPPVPAFSLWAFVKACIDVEHWINANPPQSGPPVFVAGDFLLAWANIETGNNIRWIKTNSLPGDGVGPFQLSTAEWDAFLADPLGAGYVAANRLVAMDQIAGAAFTARKATLDIAAAIEAHDAETGHNDGNEKLEPYIPTYVDILLSHLFGKEFAVRCRIRKFKKEAGVSVVDILSELHSAEDVATLISDRKKFLIVESTGEPATIDGMYLNAEAILDKAFKTAFDQINEHAPEDAAVEYRDVIANWFGEAKVQADDWRGGLENEETPAGKARIADYFNRIDFGQIDVTKPVPHWCGAFVGFCVLQGGVPTLGIQSPALAASWTKFGNVSIPIGDPKPPEGAIVVLSPDKDSSTTGHVGLFSHYAGTGGDTVFLLGGNQGDTVQLSKFARSKIKSIRWLSGAKGEHDIAVDNAGGADGQFGPLLDFIAFYESTGNYDAYFGKARNENDPKLVTKTISEVLTFQRSLISTIGYSASGRYQFVHDTLRGLVSDGFAKKTDLFDKVTQDKLGIALLNRRGLQKYMKDLITAESFGLRLAQEWAALPVPQTVVIKGKTHRKGDSFYAGVGPNKALVEVEPFLAAIRSIKS